MEVLLVIAALVVFPLAVDFLSVLGRFGLPADAGGQADRGVMIFVESIRWLSVRWGLRSVVAGFRRGAFDGECLYWRWHDTWRGWLVLPAIVDTAMLEREAERLAEFIARRRRERPQAPIYLVGYSCGGYLAVRALELLPREVKVEAAGLLAPAVDPKRDLREARSHLTGPLIVVSSVLDWLIGGLGTLAFGTGDRRHTPSIGMIGRRGLAGEAVDIRWHLSLVRLGYVGGHFSVAAACFIQKRIAAPMLSETAGC
jgi:pimeloyl-ACP methyl ester carboxylesterase